MPWSIFVNVGVIIDNLVLCRLKNLLVTTQWSKIFITMPLSLLVNVGEIIDNLVLRRSIKIF